MKDLWRMDNERGYWIRGRGREKYMNCDSFWTFIQCSEKVRRTVNDFETERKSKKNTIEISFNFMEPQPR